MANYKGHVGGGLLLGTVYVAALKAAPGDALRHSGNLLASWQFVIGLYVIAVLFALWPDVDTNSKGQNIFYGLAFMADVLLILSGRIEAAAYLGLLAMTPIVGHHRGWTHSKLAMFLVTLPLVAIPYMHKSQLWQTMLMVYGAAVAGYFSHLLFDGLVFKHFRIRGSRYD